METCPFPRLFVLDFLSDAEKASLKSVEGPTNEQDAEQAHQCPLAAAEAAESSDAEPATHEVISISIQLLVLEHDVNNHPPFMRLLFQFLLSYKTDVFKLA